MEAALSTFGFAGVVRMPFFGVQRGSSFPVQRDTWHGIRRAFRTGSLVAGSRDAATDDLAEVRAIAAGDSIAFRRLIDRESPRLLRFALGLLGNLDEAEDTVQETLLRLWENAATWTPDARIGTWLHRVCYNRSIDRLRRRRSFVDDSALDVFPDDAQPPDLQLVRSERVHDVREAVARLSPRQRTAVLLFHFQDLPQREAAEVMGISEVALESLLARARRQMRRWLAVDEDEND
jgi:RNA polymerase sigma-70 factor (ECF subfamily)